MHTSAFPRLRAALWAVLLLALATAAASSFSLHRWLSVSPVSAPLALSSEPAAVVPGGIGLEMDHSAVSSLEPGLPEDLPELSVAAYER